MQPEPVISVRKVTKVFRMDTHYQTSLSESIKKQAAKVLGKSPKKKIGDKIALDEISFTVSKGSTVGIIGRNGSGKSTLLRLLAGIMEPTSGQIEIKGTVTSILDIGSGFIAELTGKENVLMAGSLMGMEEAGIKQRMAEIVAFSEIGDYIDVPVKYYSSGMYLRLAFSLAVHLDMDVLLIDEVIEVGDEAFKIKSYNKIKQLTDSGHTVLICTHNMRSVAELCNECIVMEKGQIIAQGEPQEMVGEYIENIWNKSYELDKGSLALTCSQKELNQLPKNDWIKLTHFGFSQPDEPTQLYTDKVLTIELQYQKLVPHAAINASIWVYDSNHRPIISSNSMPWVPIESPDEAGQYTVTVSFPAYFFNKGLFLVMLHFVKDNERLVFEYPHHVPFKLHLRHTDTTNLKTDGRNSAPLYMELPWKKRLV